MRACPYCEGQVSESATKCRHCGEWLDERAAADAAPTTRGRDKTLAGISSLVVPGLGQFLQGRPVAAVLFFVWAVMWWWVMLGWLVHLVAAYDAAVRLPLTGIDWGREVGIRRLTERARSGLHERPSWMREPTSRWLLALAVLALVIAVFLQ
jgi:hypothetical protein